jgi:hypothetical protein
MRLSYQRLVVAGIGLAAVPLVAGASLFVYRFAAPPPDRALAALEPRANSIETIGSEQGPARPRFIPTTQAQEHDALIALQARAAAAATAAAEETRTLRALETSTAERGAVWKKKKSKKRRTARKTRSRTSPAVAERSQ